MKPRKFKQGQAITRKKSGPGRPVNHNTPAISPPFGKIFHVLEYHMINGEWYITLFEYGDRRGFNEIAWEPVVDDAVIEKELSEIFQTIEV